MAKKDNEKPLINRSKGGRSYGVATQLAKLRKTRDAALDGMAETTANRDTQQAKDFNLILRESLKMISDIEADLKSSSLGKIQIEINGFCGDDIEIVRVEVAKEDSKEDSQKVAN